MKTHTITLFVLIILASLSMIRSQDDGTCNPTQIHISYGDIYYTVSQDSSENQDIMINNNQVYLVWHTSTASCTFSIVVSDPVTSQTVFTTSAAYYDDFFYDFGAPDAAISQYNTNNGTYSTVAYTALFSGLQYEKDYTYTITDLISGASQGPFTFRMPTPYLKSTSRKIFLAGDMDALENGIKTIDAFTALSQTNFDDYGGWIMMGDAGYDVETDNGTRGDSYFQATQPFSAVWPSVMALGNHDIYANWSFMNLRIRNPLFNLTQNQYFSYNQEGIHFTFINLDYYDKASADAQAEAYNWLDADLATANTPENRANWPWLIFVAHRPIYCGYREQGDQDIPASSWCYSFYAKRQIWDELIHKYSVDLMLTAHKHSYERMGPIYRNKSASYTKMANDPLSHYIIDPEATVFIMEGSGGNVWYTPEPYQAEGWALVADVNPGYGQFYVQNNTNNITLVYEHYDSGTGERVDYMYLVRNRAGQATEGGTSGWLILFIILVLVVGAWYGYDYWKKRQQEQEGDSYNYAKDKDIPLIELKR